MYIHLCIKRGTEGRIPEGEVASVQPSSTNKLERKAFQVHLMKCAYFRYANDNLATCLANYSNVYVL